MTRCAIVIALLLVLLAPSVAFAAADADVSERSLALSAPEQVTVGLLPVRLNISSSPSSTQTGLDCGMPEMCGLDPCLCGIPDAYGACACNGTETTATQLLVASADEGVARVLRMGEDYWVVPWGTGSTTITVHASLPHHTDATASIEVEVQAPFAPVLLFTGVLLVLLVGVVLACRALRTLDSPLASACGEPRSKPGVTSKRHARPLFSTSTTRAAAVCSAVLLATLLALCALPLGGCTASPTVSEGSPRVAFASVSSSGGTEASQRVELRIVFNQPLIATGPLKDDLLLTLNDKPLDTSAIATAVLLEDENTLLVTLAPAEGTGDTTSAHYFALYEGKLSVAARDASGGLAHLVAAPSAEGEGGRASRASALINTPLIIQIPSGLVIELAESTVGNVALGVAAQATFRVVEVPCIRAISWIELEPGGERALVHNHDFASYSNNATGCERYAAYLTGPLKRAFGSNYTITAQGDTVTVSATAITDGQLIVPAVCEGVGT
jgi:hypothetical protein